MNSSTAEGVRIGLAARLLAPKKGITTSGCLQAGKRRSRNAPQVVAFMNSRTQVRDGHGSIWLVKRLGSRLFRGKRHLYVLTKSQVKIPFIAVEREFYIPLFST
ncbi:hypothetical protein B5F76_01875 [Desulfovibrio sp. An276]|nr:hypothetical protein B5F76_01875 [Desulfovibrio sp. An276]